MKIFIMHELYRETIILSKNAAKLFQINLKLINILILNIYLMCYQPLICIIVKLPFINTLKELYLII